MKKCIACFLFNIITILSFAQPSVKIINENEVKRIETALSADNMEGRKTFTPGNGKAADFITSEFKKAGLKTLKGLNSYKQNFAVTTPKRINISALFGGKSLDSAKIFALTCQPDLTVTSGSGFTNIFIQQESELRKKFGEFARLKENIIVFVDSSLTDIFNRLYSRKYYLFKSDKSAIFVLGKPDTEKFEIKAKYEIIENQAANVVGVLPGKSKKEEIVIFSAHYDHLGIGEEINKDSIYNGANDDASGVTAVIALAKYFKSVHNNERTLVFAAFTAEEIGGYGSQYFSAQINAEKAIAMFNIEMIGTESKWGKSSAYITGFEKSDMGQILQKNLKGSKFSFYADPYPEQDLFYRSDNATLARLGVAAHTISTSKMDNEPNYHKLSDNMLAIDFKNMTGIIQSIALSAKTIISGRDTPARVKADLLTK